MKEQKKYVISVFAIFMMIMITVFISFSTVNTAQAETKASLEETEMTIGIGTYGRYYGFIYNKTEHRYAINVVSAHKSATYTFSSSNKKVVTVKASGTKGLLTGVASGTATITCKQTLNGTTTVVGKAKVTVKRALLEETHEAARLTLGTGSLGSWVQEPICYIRYRIPDAKYTYSTGSKNLTIKDTRYEETQAGEGYFGFKQTYTAKKAGTYTVTVKETYKDVTRKVGSFKVVIHDLEIEDSYTLAPKESVQASYLLSYPKRGKKYYFEGDGFDAGVKNSNTIAYIQKDNYGNDIIYGVKEGTCKFNIYEGTSEADKKLVGSCTIRVDENYIVNYQTNFVSYVGANSSSIYFRTSPNALIEDITISISDESIIDIYDEAKLELLKCWYFKPLKAGTTTVTAKYGDNTATCTVTVYPSYEEYLEAVSY
ncbi:MAG: Ig domain protein group 2 domain protein [Anaerocolumna sp.]|jgi:hypothetical protein|nr:Ig domain protein group 2 domain protein [Anaerocolumna sp.]